MTPDYLPNPETCLIAGIWPSRLKVEGVAETEFIGRIHAELP